MLFFTLLFAQHLKFSMIAHKETIFSPSKLDNTNKKNLQNTIVPIEYNVFLPQINPQYIKSKMEQYKKKKLKEKVKKLIQLLEEYIEEIKKDKVELERFLQENEKIYQENTEETKKIIDMLYLLKQQEETKNDTEHLRKVMEAIEEYNPNFKNMDLLDVETIGELWKGFYSALKSVSIPLELIAKQIGLDPKMFDAMVNHPNKDLICLPLTKLDENNHPLSTLLFLMHTYQGLTCGIYDKNPSQHDINMAFKQIQCVSQFFPCSKRILIPSCDAEQAIKLWNTAVQFNLQPVWGNPEPRLSLEQKERLIHFHSTTEDPIQREKKHIIF